MNCPLQKQDRPPEFSQENPVCGAFCVDQKHHKTSKTAPLFWHSAQLDKISEHIKTEQN